MKRILEEAIQIIRARSISPSGNEEVANYAASILKDRGFNVQLQRVAHSFEDVSKRQFNVIGVFGDPLVDKKIRKGLLLLSHLDTSSPGRIENWNETNHNPFVADIRSGKIYGLGTVEAKMDFLCKLYAALKFRDKKLKMPIYLVGTCGDELGMLGSRYLIKSGALNPKHVLVGAPTNLHLIHTQKHTLTYKVRIKYHLIERDAKGFNRRICLHSFGRVAHGAHPEEGQNAIRQLFDVLRQANINGFKTKLARWRGGDAINQVPDLATADFFLNSHQFEDFKRFYIDAVHSKSPELFKVEVGGLGESGVRFIPDDVFHAALEIESMLNAFATQFKDVENADFNPPHSTVNVGTLTQNFTELGLGFEIRTIPENSVEDVKKSLAEKVSEIRSRHPQLNIEVELAQFHKSFHLDQDRELAMMARNSLSDAGKEPFMEALSVSTEASLFAEAGFDTLVFGPGNGPGTTHCPNENMELGHMETAVLFYQKMIEKVCL